MKTSELIKKAINNFRELTKSILLDADYYGAFIDEAKNLAALAVRGPYALCS